MSKALGLLEKITDDFPRLLPRPREILAWDRPGKSKVVGENGT
jgi:hypothetical protein